MSGSPVGALLRRGWRNPIELVLSAVPWGEWPSRRASFTPTLGVVPSPMLAAAAMNLSSVLVIVNALRLRHVSM